MSDFQFSIVCVFGFLGFCASLLLLVLWYSDWVWQRHLDQQERLLAVRARAHREIEDAWRLPAREPVR